MAKAKPRKKRQKRARKQIPRQFAGLKEKLEQGYLRRERIVVEPRGETKMSEVLTDFVEPYLQSVDTKQDHQKLLMMAIVAWNAALFPEEEQQDMIDNLVRQLSSEGSEEEEKNLKQFVNELITRKKRFFAEHKRAIIDFELIDQGDSYYLSVASTL